MKSGLLKLPELVFPPTRYVQVFVARSRAFDYYLSRCPQISLNPTHPQKPLIAFPWTAAAARLNSSV